MAVFNFGDIEDAFLFVSSGPYGENEAYLNVETGEILYRSDMGDIDEIGENDADWEQMIEIPHKNYLDLGQNLVFEFIASTLPDEYDRVRDIFRRRGAYGRFRELLDSKGLLEAWYSFENDRVKQALRLWCEENQIKLSD
jgi:hypothetical protein